jgi:NAD(P)-dependent dehydrogenase (short-subunit alcohol dehydrogenase family)
MMKLFDEETDQAITAMQHTPQLFKWLAMPEEVAALIGFLLSDDSRFVTKATYSIDGGWCG